MRHDSAKEPSSKGKKRKPKKIADRKVMGDCALGDVVRDPDGRVCIITAWLAGGPFGRYLDGESEGDFVALDASTPIHRIRGTE